MRVRISALLVLVCLVAVLGAAQDRGTLAGIAIDASGAVMPGVKVTVTGPDTRSSFTDQQGRFTFVGLPAGTYNVSFDLAGFVSVQQQATVSAGNTVTLSATMRVGVLSETITVTGVSRGMRGGRSVGMPPPPPAMGPGDWRSVPPRDVSNESYNQVEENPFRRVSDDPLSTFSIDVDTASYANVRRFLNEGTMPPADAVRIEEFVNYFRFNYQRPSGDAPFSITTELAECPWNKQHWLALVGLQGRELPKGETPARNLVFLVDVSGSMDSSDKLPLVQHGLRMLAGTLNSHDRVAIVVYAGSSGVVLPSTRGDRKQRIEQAIDELRAGGSTNGSAGIQRAYKIAREQFVASGVNRVILATDGDFNVGVTDQDELVQLIEKERESGVFLSVLGVGTGNLKDSTMERLADKGNGNYSYLDSLQEARKVLVAEASGTLVTIAKDVKVQMAFNPSTVRAYRLIGYENRMLANRDFNDDKKDAGEIGAGHSVTAIYEIEPERRKTDPGGVPEELVTVKLRYKEPSGDSSKLISEVVLDRPQALGANLGFASAVAEAGMLLHGSKHAGRSSYASAAARARKFRGDDPDGYRAEFARLMELASTLSARTTNR